VPVQKQDEEEQHFAFALGPAPKVLQCDCSTDSQPDFYIFLPFWGLITCAKIYNLQKK
jgi:hypothetical protein